jgi:hypothetical protein
MFVKQSAMLQTYIITMYVYNLQGGQGSIRLYVYNLQGRTGVILTMYVYILQGRTGVI